MSAYSLEHSLRQQARERDGEPARDTGELAERLRMLPPGLFPNTVAHADALTSGRDHERFDFTVDLLLRGLSSGK